MSKRIPNIHKVTEEGIDSMFLGACSYAQDGGAKLVKLANKHSKKIALALFFKRGLISD